MCVALYNDTLPWLVLPPVLTVIDIISYWFSPQTIFLNYFALELNFCSCFRFFSMQETNQFLSCCQEGDLKGIELTCRFLRTGRHFIYLFIYVGFFCLFFSFPYPNLTFDFIYIFSSKCHIIAWIIQKGVATGVL